MIYIKFEEPDTAEWKQWRKKCVKATEELINSVTDDAVGEVTNLYKEDYVKRNFFFSKTGPFHGKCAYCEHPLHDFSHADVDHFRPKKGVTDIDHKEVMVTDNEGNLRKHKGYYWLAYDWKNLLPSCKICNQYKKVPTNKTIGKKNRFPVSGKHATCPEEISEESPLLINPTEDDPSVHLQFHPNGLVSHLSPRGEACINVFGLNERDQLVEERRKAFVAAHAALSDLIKIYESDRREEVEVLKNTVDSYRSGRATYSASARSAIIILGKVYNMASSD